ncbi:BZIP domain-containing protein [Fusarium sp. Ph1]|nr:BZIP domain-containing protein [Fusarium sp. Ph1]
MPRPKKNAPSELTTTKIDKDERKKLRNRLSQRAFRRRQAESLRELKNRVNASQAPDNERVLALEQENGRLRVQLARFQSQLEGVQATFSLMSKTLSSILDEKALPSISRQSSAEEEDSGPSTAGNLGISQVETVSTVDETCPISDVIADQASDINSAVNSALQPIPVPDPTPMHDLIDSIPQTEPPLSTSPLQLQQVPRIWSFEYQMGHQSYTDALSACLGGFTHGLGWAQSNSPLSDHIQILKRLLSTKVDMTRPVDAQSYQNIFQSVSIVWALFNSVTRPDVMNWLSKTKFFHIIELTVWQILPCPYTLSRVHRQYRPTQLQTTFQGQYPCVVDWVPFPLIRDRLIQFHAANPFIDQIFCEAVSAYVVESQLSDLVIGCPPLKVYIRVTDLVVSMAGQEWEDADVTPTLPAAQVQTLFTSPRHARLVFEHLKMDRGSSYYKIDPSFFEKYPELYTPSDEKVATGIPLRPDIQTTITRPNQLNGNTVAMYSNFIDFMFHVSSTISHA